MNSKTKLLLSIIGLSAIIIPAALLVFLTSKTSQDTPNIPTGARQIDKKNIEDTVKRIPKQDVVFASPKSSTPSASPAGATSSAR